VYVRALVQVRTSELQESIQLGIRISVGSVVRRPQRDLLFTDFQEVESLQFPKFAWRVRPGQGGV
jgi:hypothetical protein